jgi:hypothetical protein
VHRVLCSESVELGSPTHLHVAALGVEDADGTVARWPVVSIIDRIRHGESFVLDWRGEKRTVEPAVCARCAGVTLESVPRVTTGLETLLRLAPCS